MLLAALILSLGARGEPSTAEAPRAAGADRATDEDGPRFRIGLLSAPGLDVDGLRDALALRLPGIELRTEWSDESSPDRVFISVHPTSDAEAVRTEVIVGDGRGYVRRLDVPPTDARLIASVLANLLFSIEEQSVAADVEDVEVPLTSEVQDVERAVARLEGEPEPAVESEPTVESEPAADPEAAPEPELVPETSPSPWRWRASVPVAGGVLLPVGGPRFGSLLQGGGVELGADAEHRGGARFGLRVRLAARESLAFRISRLRVAVGGGYGWQVGRLDLPLRAELSVEPWWVVFEGDRLSAEQLGASAGSTVAIGAGVRFEPAIRIPVDAGALTTVRIGPTLAISGSFVVDDGARVATILSGDPDTQDAPLFRVGGAELWLGASIGLVLGRPAARSPSNP